MREIWDLLDTSDVMLGKLPASTSGIHQVADVSPVFKAAKAKLANSTYREASIALPVLKQSISTALVRFEEESNIGLSAEKKAKIVQALTRCVWSIQETLTTNTIKAGWTTTGQYPLLFEKVIGRCYQKLPKDVLDQLKTAESTLVETFKELGEVPEEAFDEAGIPRYEEDPNQARDQGRLCRHRAVLVCHPNTLKKVETKYSNDETVAQVISSCSDPKKKKELQNAAKIVANEEKKKENAIKRKAVALKKKSMTQEEKAQEAQKKAAKAAQRQAEIEKAKATLRNALDQASSDDDVDD